MIEKINLAAKLAQFPESWSPRIIAELNGQHVKVVKLAGDFVWHHHDDEDELFLVIAGQLTMGYRDTSGAEQTLVVDAGEFVVIPRGVEHCPSADVETHVLLFEPAGTINTGNLNSERTVTHPQRL